jgi:DNA polymerase I
MKLTFWLLDINYEIKNDKPEIWLWGISSSGERVLVIDRNFQAYSTPCLKTRLMLQQSSKKFESNIASINKFEAADRRFFGNLQRLSLWSGSLGSG